MPLHKLYNSQFENTMNGQNTNILCNVSDLPELTRLQHFQDANAKKDDLQATSWDTNPPVIVLAGGLGTRLRTLDPLQPKPMIQVKGKPFLYWLFQHYIQQGFKDFLVSTGHQAQVIETYPWHVDFPQARFVFYREEKPLGTGGAVRNIFEKNPSLHGCWVLNGDTFLPHFLPLYLEDFLATFLVLEQNELFDATSNLLVHGQYVIGEKIPGDYFDAGAVFTKKQAILNRSELQVSNPPFSLHQLLKAPMQNQQVGYIVLPGTCYDIGTPERYKRFENYLDKKEQDVQRT